MFNTYRAQGFIFKKNDINESDRVFSIFTKEFGRLEIFAKSIRKINSKLRGGIDSFYWSNVEFIQGKNHKTLTDSILLKNYNNIFSEKDKLYLILKVSDILNKGVNGSEKNESLFILIQEVFDILENQEIDNKKKEMLYFYFLWNFFSTQGESPEVSKCASCRDKLNPQDLYFSFKEGGVVCKKCQISDINNKEINSDIVKVLRIILKKDWTTLCKIKMEEHSYDLFQKTSDIALAHISS